MDECARPEGYLACGEVVESLTPSGIAYQLQIVPNTALRCYMAKGLSLWYFITNVGPGGPLLLPLRLEASMLSLRVLPV
jgi:hypothetical protein